MCGDSYLFQMSEKIGRQRVIDCINNNSLPFIKLTQTIGDYDKWDLEGITYNKEKGNYKNLNIECKNRKCTSSTYPDITINWDKFIKNVDAAKELGRVSVLAATYSDNVCRFWNLSDIYKRGKFKKETKYMPLATAEDRGYTMIDIVHLNNNDSFSEYGIYKETTEEEKK